MLFPRRETVQGKERVINSKVAYKFGVVKKVSQLSYGEKRRCRSQKEKMKASLFNSSNFAV